MILNSVVKLKFSIYGSYKIILYDMRKYGKFKLMRSNFFGLGMGFNMNSNVLMEVKVLEIIFKLVSGVGFWFVGYEVILWVYLGNLVQN